jgi:hypothetical protein
MLKRKMGGGSVWISDRLTTVSFWTFINQILAEGSFMFKKLLAVVTLAAVLFLVGRIALPSGGEIQLDKASQARQLAVLVQRFAKAIPVMEKAFLKQTGLKLTGNERVSDQNFQVLHKTAGSSGPGTIIGHTAYNYQTNDNLHDRIIWNPVNGTIHTQWIYGDISESIQGFPNRRDRYNFFNGTSWAFTDQGVPIEGERSGFGSLAIDANDVAVPVSHVNAPNNEGTVAWLDFQAGFGFFSPLKVYRKTDAAQPRIEALWPDIAVDRQGNYHVVAINNNIEVVNGVVTIKNTVLNGVLQNVLYWKSTDQGKTWSNYHVLFPNATMYPLEEHLASNIQMAFTDGVQIAVSDTDNGKVGILVGSSNHTFYYFESNDGGNTWKDVFNITSNFRLRDPETFDLIPQQFDIILVDSTSFGRDIDTTAIEFGNYVQDGPIDSRPQGSADLMYINGEPHVVWSEAMGVIDNGVVSAVFPNGAGYGFTTPVVRLLKGGSEHREGGFAIKHWSPSTGIPVVVRENRASNSWSGSNYLWLGQPQIGIDRAGNLYCLYTRFDDADTLSVRGQRRVDFGPLSFGEIWGAKSSDNGATWFESVRLTETFHEDERYIGVSDLNPNEVVHLIYQTSANIPGSAINDHSTFVNSEIRHWAAPTSLFPTTPQLPEPPEIDLSAGVLDFLNTPGIATRSFTIANLGDTDLVVETIFVVDDRDASDRLVPDPVTKKNFTIIPTSFTIPPRGEQQVDVTYKATMLTPKPDTLLLAIPNNDPSEHSRGLVILASATSTSVASRDIGAIPSQYALEQNYPNPISVTGKSKLTALSTTEIRYALKANGHAKIRIYDVLGREIAVLVNGTKPAGEHRVNWYPAEAGVTAGLYFYSLEVNGFRETKKMVLLP